MTSFERKPEEYEEDIENILSHVCGLIYVSLSTCACDNIGFQNVCIAGTMKGLAFIKDPDGYWIEIFDVARMSAS